MLLAGKRREKKSPRSSSSKKIIAYAAIGIIALAAVSVAAFSPRAPAVDPETESQQQALLQFRDRYCGEGGQAMTTSYLTEFVLPSNCEMPLAIEADGGRVWYVSTKNGTLGSYNAAEDRFEQERQIPSWPSRSSSTAFSMAWSAKADSSGNIWLTDERQRALWRYNESQGTFSMFPVAAQLPSSVDFDSDGKIYFAGVQSTSIFIGNPNLMKDGTSDGMTEVPLPLDGFSEADRNLVTTGSLVVDTENEKVWVSLLAFQKKGQLFLYDIASGTIEQVVDLPADITSPVGLALDASGDLWVTDHGTNIFVRYDQETGEFEKFVTSIASPRIYAGRDLPNAYTLPYWIEHSPDSGLLWFNQHTGNKISSFDPERLVLTEYWVPSQNSNWALCPEDSNSCGLANALQFSSDAGGQTWFTEWTQNKIGVVDGSKAAPITVTVQQAELTISRGDSTEIRVTVDAESSFDGRMMASSTITPNGRLGNSTGIFSEQTVSVRGGESKEISYTFTPDNNIQPGRQTIMIGAGNDEISVLKAVTVNIL